MVWHETEGVNDELARPHQSFHPREETHTVLIIEERGYPSHSAAHDVVQRPRLLDPHGPAHAPMFPAEGREINQKVTYDDTVRFTAVYGRESNQKVTYDDTVRFTTQK